MGKTCHLERIYDRLFVSLMWVFVQCRFYVIAE